MGLGYDVAGVGQTGPDIIEQPRPFVKEKTMETQVQLPAVLLAALLAGCNAPGISDPAAQDDLSQGLATREGLVVKRGEPLTLIGEGVSVGEEAPDFVAVAGDMSEKRLSDYRGRTVILSVVPSLDTGTCAVQTRTFNERAAALGEGVVVVTISLDLPMAQGRFCTAEGIDRVETLSDYKYWSFAQGWGLRIQEIGLLARALYVVDAQGKIVHEEITHELTAEPDYDAAIQAAGAAAAGG